MNIFRGYKIVDKDDLVHIFDEIKEEEIDNNLKPLVEEDEGLFSYFFEDSHFVFINNLTIAFNKVQFNEDNLRFYIDDEAIGAIAILNIDKIVN